MTASMTTSLIGSAPSLSGSRPRRPDRRWPRRRAAPRATPPTPGVGDEHEPADVLAAGQHRQLDAVGRQLEPARPPVAAAVAHRGLRPRWRRCGRCVGRRAVVVGSASKRLSCSAAGRAARPGRRRSPRPADARTTAASATRWMRLTSERAEPARGGRSGRARRSCRPAPRRRATAGGLDVVARVDGQRQVRLGVEEVERHHRGQGGDDPGRPATEAATATTTIISTSAAFVLSNSGRNTAITAPAPTAAGTPTATPITNPVLSTPACERADSSAIDVTQPPSPHRHQPLHAPLTARRAIILWT